MTPPAMFDRPPTPPILRIPGHFGDIMSRRDTSLSLPDGFSGFERILLTANVSVKILENVQVPLKEDEDPSVIARFQREVNLLCNDKIVCNAKSQVLIKDQEVFDLVVEKGVGIGQIFRYLDKLPSFELHGLGRTEKTFWREYSLKIAGVDCRLLEVLPSSLFDENWLEKEPEEISWDVDAKEGDQLTWINPEQQSRP
ncbi:hypothetical protein BGZ80_008358 [Entomortierella chlamydospora]|uniref:Uncharacterized protein n=1 Tax=Entomortierella chlamydospora TaxID=101097 RepID=A0A9P6N3T1_9FUNG|nr:hypothetical protein BGZ80_008358 [Entomortierella chlamydospora]